VQPLLLAGFVGGCGLCKLESRRRREPLQGGDIASAKPLRSDNFLKIVSA
jgi:hypothetical protein